jgi:hypothetical protein
MNLTDGGLRKEVFVVKGGQMTFGTQDIALLIIAVSLVLILLFGIDITE